MYIIVVGGGSLGYFLTKALLEEGQEVLIIERDAALSESIKVELGSICMHGDGCETTTLGEAGAARADILIAVTGDDEDNLVACQVAKHQFNVPRTIARVRNPKNETIFKKLGVDVTVISTNIILEHIEHELPTHALTRLMTLSDRGLEIVEVKIPPGSSSIGQPVGELALPEGSTLNLIIRKNQKPTVPRTKTILKEDDQVIALVPPESVSDLRAILRGD